MHVYVGSILLYFIFVCVGLVVFAVNFCCPYSVPVQVIAWWTVSEMTCNVSSGTLNLTHRLTDCVFSWVQVQIHCVAQWRSRLVVSALGIRARGPGFDSRVAPLFHWVATLGKLFTHIASPVSQLQETGVPRSFWRLSDYGDYVL